VKALNISYKLKYTYITISVGVTYNVVVFVVGAWFPPSTTFCTEKEDPHQEQAPQA